MTDPMGMALLRLVITLARHLVSEKYTAHGAQRAAAVLAAADEAERVCNERARIS